MGSLGLGRAPAGPTRLLRHTDCGGEVQSRLFCTGCGARVGAADVTALPGPALLARQAHHHGPDDD